jgi:hypothetical protein
MPTVGAEKIAKALNISPRRVRQLAEAGVLPRESHGRYDFVKCILAAARTKVERLPEIDEKIPGLTAERERRLRVQRERDEIRLARERGDLIPVEIFQSKLSEAITILRERVLQLKRIAPELEGESRAAIERKLDAAVRKMLDSLAEIADGNGNRPQHTHSGSESSTRPGLADLVPPGGPADPAQNQ